VGGKMQIDNLNFNFYFVTAKEYSKTAGLSYRDVLEFCKTGKLEALKTEGGQWKVKVYKGDTVSREEYNRLLEEKNRIQGVLDSVAKLVMHNDKPEMT